jgi:hypothetical protein
MARAAQRTPRKAKKPAPISRGKSKIFDLKHYGDEPIIEGSVSVSDLRYMKAINWYNYMHDIETGREYLVDYMKMAKFQPAQISMVRRASKNNISPTMCWQARIMYNGTKLSAESMNFFNKKLEHVFARDFRPTASKSLFVIQDRITQKINNMISDLENEIDNFMAGGEFSVYDFLKAAEASSQAAGAIRAYYAPSLEMIRSPDAQVKEAYGKNIKKWLDFYTTLDYDCDRFINNKKVVKVRAPRKIKTKSAVDLVKRVQYQKEDAALKIVSSHPSELIGAQTVYTYNTKYKQLAVYLASGPAGITVKGTTLVGFDTELSIQKSLRKPEETTKQLLATGKVALRKFMDTIKTVARKPNGRLNETTILLKVIK